MQDDSIEQEYPSGQPIRLMDAKTSVSIYAPTGGNFQIESRYDHLLGEVLANRYRLDQVIGSGGMSVVYRGYDLRTQRAVAVKLLHRHLKFEQKYLQRFQQEGKTLSKLNHANIVKVLAYGLHEDSTPYMIMEYVEGVNLAKRLASAYKLPMEATLAIALQVCDALEHAHRMRVIHRDLKPSNIMINVDEFGNEIVKIVDFGIAKIVSETHSELTGTGEIFGSPMYMSPEQCGGLTVDRRTDLYSLGCIIFECLIGYPPHTGDSALATMMRHQQEEPMSLQEASLGEIFPDELERIVKKMLAKSPLERYGSVATLSFDLLNVKRNGYSAAAPPEKVAPGLNIFRSIQIDAAARVGITQEAIDENARRSAESNKSGIAVIGVLAGATIAILVFVVFLVSSSGFVQHYPEAEVVSYGSTQSDYIMQPSSISTTVDETKLLQKKQQEEKLWARLILKQPTWLKLNGFYELTDWKMLSHFHQLMALDASRSNFNGNELVYLKGLPLRTLDLQGLKVSKGFKSLASVPKLQSLNLAQTDVEDSDLSHLPPKLRELILDYCAITNAGFKHLLHLKELKNLSLKQIPLSDLDMSLLAQIKLESLNISNSKVTQQALNEFKRRQPNCILIGE